MTDARHFWMGCLAAAMVLGIADHSARAQVPGAVHVVTYYDLAPDRVGKVRSQLRLYREATLKAYGNSEVGVFQEIGRPGRLVVREAWRDQAAFDGHAKSPAAVLLASGLRQYEIAPPDQRIHLAFATGGGPAQAGNNTVHVFSHVDVPPPRQGELEPMLKALQAESTKVAPAVRFDVLQQSSRKNHFTVVEAWTSQRALDAQALAPVQREFRDKLGPMLGALYDQRLYRALR